MKAQSPEQATVRIWDLPTRVFHILFACVVLAAIVTAKIGQSWMDWHVRLGITALALLIFRIIWGLIGPRYARFSQFNCGPVSVWRHLKTLMQHTKQIKKTPGHSPLGALSIIAMLIIISVQAVTGLFANDEILTQGPLAQFVSGSMSAFMTGLHQFNEKLVFGIIVLHLTAVLVYTMKGQSLIRPMLTGDVPSNTLVSNSIAARDTKIEHLTALIIAALLAYCVWWLNNLVATAGLSFN